MNFFATQILLDTIKPYFNVDGISLSTENNDWKGRPYRSDFVTLIESQNVCFEVFENEIIVSYFTDHTHFEDNSFELDDGDPDYIMRAREFLIELFTLPLRQKETYKGKKRFSEKYYFVLTDGTEEYIGGHWYTLCRLFQPFAGKRTEITTWQYDAGKQCFTTVLSWKDHPNAIDTIVESDRCQIEVYENKGIYT